MSRGIVNQRPFSQKKRRQSFRKMLNRSGVSIPEFKISQKLKNILSRGMGFTILIIGGSIILVKLLFFQPGQIISQVKFSDDTEATYKNPYLFDFIVNEVKGKNYFIIKSNKDELVSKIQNGFKIKNPSGENVNFSFPFVGDIEFQLEAPNQENNLTTKDITISIQLPLELPIKGYQTAQAKFPLRLSAPDKDGGILGVQILYYDPLILIKLNGKEYAVRNENTYIELNDGMLLGIRNADEEPLFVIDTPMYLSGTNDLHGFFFDISLADFIQIANLAKESFPNMKRFVYLAGSTRIAIFTSDDKTLYFNFLKGLPIEDQRNTQIFKYNTLKEKYPNFGNIWTIDLGALEDDKVIIKY